MNMTEFFLFFFVSFLCFFFLLRYILVRCGGSRFNINKYSGNYLSLNEKAR